ncbi:hypothetical protein RF11_08121 [Thelohanellus kitauei]|uniref:Uncharacterized protein n=1 Tax=Thelohanellus kitauei TaxID=669202 RepID=A0A0C2M9R2_THEKT|nr:hypothetical protein RF11_08121 [Thelohanellus kitauei]
MLAWYTPNRFFNRGKPNSNNAYLNISDELILFLKNNATIQNKLALSAEPVRDNSENILRYNKPSVEDNKLGFGLSKRVDEYRDINDAATIQFFVRLVSSLHPILEL